ncbi:hypothetical protein ACFLZI_03180, partial [Nitrospirota bacterium]
TEIDKLIKSTIDYFESEVQEEEINQRRSESYLGSVQGQLAYSKEINDLLNNVISFTNEIPTVPCPVCKRPIDEELAKSLLHESEEIILGNENKLVEVQKKSQALQMKVHTYRDNLKAIRDFNSRLHSFPESTLTKVSPLLFENISNIVVSTDQAIDTLKLKLNEQQIRLEKIKKDIELRTNEIANMKNSLKSIERLELLSNNLRLAHEKKMLADMISNSIDATLHIQKDVMLGQVYKLISSLWDKFRPGRSWDIVLNEQGMIVAKDKDRDYDFSLFSGGEKTVLLILSRVILCKILSTKLNFIMIDEPLEHLDIRNRRSLLNFLVKSCEKNVISQMIVTTFEETLVRKYYYGEKTRIEQLG